MVVVQECSGIIIIIKVPTPLFLDTVSDYCTKPDDIPNYVINCTTFSFPSSHCSCDRCGKPIIFRCYNNIWYPVDDTISGPCPREYRSLYILKINSVVIWQYESTVRQRASDSHLYSRPL